MILDIEITWKCNIDLHPDEQEWHEQRVSFFKHEFEIWLEKCGMRTIGIVAINLYYYPEHKKFFINSITSHYNNGLIERLKSDRFYFQKHFTEEKL